jgi:hypothetical protein
MGSDEQERQAGATPPASERPTPSWRRYLRRFGLPALTGITAAGVVVATPAGDWVHEVSQIPAVGAGGVFGLLATMATHLLSKVLDGRHEVARHQQFRSTMNDALVWAGERRVTLNLPGGAHIEINPPEPKQSERRLQAVPPPAEDRG